MIAAWMLTASAIGALLLLAALAGDAACARLGWPRRWLWAMTMVAMCVLPLVPHTLPLVPDVAFVSFGRQPIVPAAATITPLAGEPGAPIDPAGPASDAAVLPPVSEVETLPITEGAPRTHSPMRVANTTARGPQLFITASSPLARVDTPLLVVWAGLSLTVVLLIGLAMQRLRRERDSWVPADGATRRAVRVIARDAVPVWRSTQLGPAAFGLGAMHWSRRCRGICRSPSPIVGSAAPSSTTAMRASSRRTPTCAATAGCWCVPPSGCSRGDAPGAVPA
jgi:hypothetical protein